MDVHVITDDAVERRSPQDLPEVLARDDGLVWVDIPSCDAEAEHVLGTVFGLHPLAVRDCVDRNRVPKMHAYPDHVLVVLHAPERGDRGHVHFVELNQIIGRNYLITVHGPVNPAVRAEVPLRETGSALARIKAGRTRPTTGIELSHAVVSALTQRQELYIEAVTTNVWRLEQAVTGGRVDQPEELLGDLFQARHGLLAVRTMAALSGGLYERMATLPGLSAASRPLVADLAGRFDRVRAVADGEREYLQGVIEFFQTTLTVTATLATQIQNERIEQLTEASYAQNEQMKRISAWAAVFFAPSLVGTVYGMNFENMPERHWSLGYPVALLLMVLGSALLYLLFRRQRWL